MIKVNDISNTSMDSDIGNMRNIRKYQKKASKHSR